MVIYLPDRSFCRIAQLAVRICTIGSWRKRTPGKRFEDAEEAQGYSMPSYGTLAVDRLKTEISAGSTVRNRKPSGPLF